MLMRALSMQSVRQSVHALHQSSGNTPRHALNIGSNRKPASAFFPATLEHGVMLTSRFQLSFALRMQAISAEYPLSEGNIQNIVVYDGKKVDMMLRNSPLNTACPNYNELASEWVRILDNGVEHMPSICLVASHVI